MKLVRGMAEYEVCTREPEASKSKDGKPARGLQPGLTVLPAGPRTGVIPCSPHTSMPFTSA